MQEIKKKKGIKDEVQLTSKQKELMHAQLEREAQIRKRLKEVSFGCIFCHSEATMTQITLIERKWCSNHLFVSVIRNEI